MYELNIETIYCLSAIKYTVNHFVCFGLILCTMILRAAHNCRQLFIRSKRTREGVKGRGQGEGLRGGGVKAREQKHANGW